MAKPPKIFVSYSHKDKKWLKRLQVHFKALERDGAVDLWDDTEIHFGADWSSEIADALGHAKAAILLVSADFLASDYIVNEELKDLLEAGEKEGLTNFMVILSPCVLGKLARFQTVNNPEHPLEGMSRMEQEKVFVNLVEAIKKILVIEPETEKSEPRQNAVLQKSPVARVKLTVNHSGAADQPPNVRVFPQEKIIIGRDPASDLLLSNPLERDISKQHAEITSDGGKLYVTDLDSMNFSYLNDERLQPHKPREIQPGNIIRIGPFEICAEILDTKPDDDLTFIDIFNPYKNDVEQLATVLCRIGEQYTRETSRRDRVMLQEALRTAMTNADQNQAYLVIGHWLLKDIGNSSSSV